MSDTIQTDRPANAEVSGNSDIKKVEPDVAEEVDLDSLQKGLAKAMVLEWKNDHPDESLDDVILSATKNTGAYDPCLLEKGIDKTLYDQWRYIKYKQSAPRLVRAKKPIEINLPERRARQPLPPTKVPNEPEENKVSEPKENLKQTTPDKSKSENNESSPLNGPQTPTVAVKHANSITQVSAERTIPSSVLDDLPKNNQEQKPILISDSKAEGGINSTSQTEETKCEKSSEDAKDSLAKIKKLLEQNKRTNETQIDVPTISKEAVDFIKDLRNFTSTVPESLRMPDLIADQKTNQPENIDEPPKTPAGNDGTPKMEEDRKKSDEKENVDKNEIPSPLPAQGAKSVLEKWQNHPPEATTYSKKKLIVVVDDGEDDKQLELNKEIPQVSKIPDDLIEKGFTKQIMNQLMNNPEESNVTAIERENSIIEKGFTKQMLDRWTLQDPSGVTSPPRKKIEIREEDGTVLESEPVERSDVVKSGTFEVPTVEKGFAKQLLDQWSKIPEQQSKSPAISKTPVVISEQDGTVAENKPEVKADVAREGETEAADHRSLVREGTTKSLLGKWNDLQTTTFKKESKPVTISESDGSVCENQPTERSDVVRAEEVLEDAPVRQGITKSLVSQWKNMNLSLDETSKTAIKINEDDGFVAENEPKVRTDVLKEGDDGLTANVVKKGTTKALLDQWTTKKYERPSSSAKEIVISESDGRVVENEPTSREDVVRESDDRIESAVVSKGTTRSLMKLWTTGGASPAKRDGEEAAEVTESVKGMTKKLLNQWNSGSLAGKTESERHEKRVVLDKDGGCVAENDPCPRREDVYREEERVDEQFPTKGQTNLILQKLISRQDTSARKEPINLFEGAQGQKAVVENEPTTRDDVAREEDFSEEILHMKGFARSMVGFWNSPQNDGRSSTRQAVIELADGPTVFENEPAPSIMKNFKPATESGVFENQPVSRQDVTREADCEPEIISANMMRNVRKLWLQKETQSNTQKTPTRVSMPVRFTPPREKSPPAREEFKSSHALILTNSKTDSKNC